MNLFASFGLTWKASTSVTAVTLHRRVRPVSSRLAGAAEPEPFFFVSISSSASFSSSASPTTSP